MKNKIYQISTAITILIIAVTLQAVKNLQKLSLNLNTPLQKLFRMYLTPPVHL